MGTAVTEYKSELIIKIGSCGCYHKKTAWVFFLNQCDVDYVDNGDDNFCRLIINRL